jgi:hypothetical protein
MTAHPQCQVGKIRVFVPFDPTSHLGFGVRYFQRECDIFKKLRFFWVGLPTFSWAPECFFRLHLSKNKCRK